MGIETAEDESKSAKPPRPVWEADPRISPVVSSDGAVTTQRLTRDWSEYGGGEEDALLLVEKGPGGRKKRTVILYDGQFRLTRK